MIDQTWFTAVAWALVRDDDHLARLHTALNNPLTRVPSDDELAGPTPVRALHQTLVGPDGTWLVLNTRSGVIVYVSDPMGA